MTKKKNDENKDLTRIEDLSEFLHSEDSDLDSKFDSFQSFSQDDDSSSVGIALDELPTEEELPPEVPNDEMSFEVSSEEDSSEPIGEFAFSNMEEEQESFQAQPFETSLEESEEIFQENFSEEEAVDEVQESTDDILSNDFQLSSTSDFSDSVSEEELAPEPILRDESSYTNTSEKFDDVRTFAQNFSYGKASVGGGNPPYSIIARHIKYQEEADDIFELLREFGLINDQNEKETKRSLELGSLIVPQISEYTAIVLAHKLRRFDLDLEVGLSDEVHPSKSGEGNPRGLIKKDNLRQNRSESLKLSEIDVPIKDIIVTTGPQLPGYQVESYIGVQTTFAIVEESELEKLQYVQKIAREHTEIFNMEDIDSTLTSEKAFRDYQNSFALLYEDLATQLKQKAYLAHANALLGLNFQLSPLQFERSHKRINAYQITCSATLAIVGPETT